LLGEGKKRTEEKNGIARERGKDGSPSAGVATEASSGKVAVNSMAGFHILKLDEF
jgi:hypothetical protein